MKDLNIQIAKANAIQTVPTVGDLPVSALPGAMRIVEGPLVSAIYVWDSVSGAWILVSQALDGSEASFDFTGTDYNTDAKLLAGGVIKSDSALIDGAFPSDLIKWGVTTQEGTLVHSASKGWYAVDAAIPTNYGGPILLFPEMSHSSNIEIDVTISYTPSNVNESFYGVIMLAGANMGIVAAAIFTDNDLANKELTTILQKSDGDGTAVGVYSGTPLANPVGDYTIKLRNRNGILEIYDPQDSTWHKYTTIPAQNAENGIRWVIQIARYAANTLTTNLFIKSVEYFRISPAGVRI